MNPEKAKLVKLTIATAGKTLNEVEQILVENELWNNAVNRLYYACFYAVTALLAHYDFDTKTHSGVKRLFGLHFIKPGVISEESGEFYSNLFRMRQRADYEVEVDYEKDDVLKLIPPSKDLINRIAEILSKDDTQLRLL